MHDSQAEPDLQIMEYLKIYKWRVTLCVTPFCKPDFKRDQHELFSPNDGNFIVRR